MRNVYFLPPKNEEEVIFLKHFAQLWLTRPELIPVSVALGLQHEAAGSISTPPDGILVQRRLTPSININSPVPIYTPKGREAP